MTSQVNGSDQRFDQPKNVKPKVGKVRLGHPIFKKCKLLSSCDSDPFSNLREPTWVDTHHFRSPSLMIPLGGAPLGMTHFV